MLELLIIVSVGAVAIGTASVFLYVANRKAQRSVQRIETEAAKVAEWKYKVSLEPFGEPEVEIATVVALEDEPVAVPTQPAPKIAKPQCLAITEAQHQCRNSARGLSAYCASHKGYHPLTADGLAKRIEGSSWKSDDKLSSKKSLKTADTKPASKRGKNTKMKVRKNQKTKKGKK